MKFIFLKSLLLLFLIQATPSIASDVQDVYQYENSKGVTEFTDQVKPEKELIEHTQLKKMTPEEKVQSESKLNQIIEEDKARDLERAKQKEREVIRTRKRSDNGSQDNQKSDDDDTDVIWGRRPYVRPPVRPEHPIAKPPVRPKHPIARPGPRR